MKRMHILILAMVLWIIVTPGFSSAESLLERYCIIAERWEEIFRRGNITVYSQGVPDSDVLAFRAVGRLDAPVEQVMEVLRRLEITGEWMPDVKAKFALKEFSDFQAVTYSVNDLPWPFADREMVLFNELRIDPVRKYLVVEVYSVDFNAYPTARGNVRAQMHCGETRLRPAPDGRTDIELILYVDPMGFIPAWLVNLSQKKLPYNFLHALEKKARQTEYTLRPSYRKLLDKLEFLLAQTD